METAEKPARELDLTGLFCPLPVIRIREAVMKVKLGELVKATASDPGVLADIPAWAKSTGNQVVSMERNGKLITFLVRRTK